VAPVAVLALLLLAAPPAPDPAASDVLVLLGTFVPGAQPDGNTVVFRAPEGLVVVDTGRHAAHTRRILDVARSTGLPIAAVVNTHWHLDHVGGNPMVRQAFPSVSVSASRAIDDALTGFLADYRTQLLEAIEASSDPAERTRHREEVARIDGGRSLAPDIAIEATGDLLLAGRPMEVGLEGPAATAGDVWVFDRSSGLLAAGDLVTLPAPLFDTACPRGWLGALAHLSEIPFLLLAPGHGRPMTRQEFAAYRAGLDQLVACAASDQADIACIDGWLRDLGPLVPEPERPLARSLLAYYLPNVLRAPPDRVARLCRQEPRDGTVR
jgi:glyoxylase-like metal-dependent hydrolase (beta-lactamase superfamily II)